MAASTSTPIFHANPRVSLSPYLPKYATPRTRNKPIASKGRVFTQFASTPHATLSDPFVLEIAETLEDSIASDSLSTPPPLQKLRDTSSQSLLSTPWPSRKDEPFRFTDFSSIKNSQIQPVESPLPESLDSLSFSTDIPSHSIAIVDGYIVNSLSQLSELPNGVFVGGLSSIGSEGIMKRVSEYVSSFQGDLFWSLNGIGAQDVVVVYVPEGCRVESPLYLRFFSIEHGDKEANKLPISNPRVLVLVEKGGEVGVIEEYMGGNGDKSYWANSVMEVIIGEGATFTHSYIQNQSIAATHIKWTSVQQESSSTYKLVEVSIGGKLSRHNVHVQQSGPDTVTDMSTFHLSLGNQLQDLHSSVILDHPRGFARQLHKCIVAHSSGQSVFDGNIKVNREAQQTDAGQLTRSLLLAPRATLNVKPNLQIIADDVKCSHGAAISDLEENQIFYLQARGIDLKTARKALTYSFAVEVTERFSHPSIRKKVEDHMKTVLDRIDCL